ncbi:hypothetical protein [Vallicoccus soli]|uniref:Uncharacterized protein n=1 Tax=Vallicoccus soli TaxID=2339232 RepID=A0A3A3Z1Y6_9ACTN|nr:hypothetical protein [Vallicoccus soli]RJK95478.1 hypothetical protein D5H78_12630 [Vallicoccus soli]
MPLRARAVRRQAAAWSLMPALLATGLLAAGVGGAERMNRAEKAVAARLSWCGLDERSVAVAQAQWEGQRTLPDRVADVLVVPPAPQRGEPSGRVSTGEAEDLPRGGLRVVASPAPDGGWHVAPADAATSRALDGCLDD